MIRILVVEDDNSVSLLITSMLKKLGYDIAGVVNSADKAYYLIEKEHPGLILMDVMIKGETDGIMAAAYIKQKYNIPFIYLTAASDEKSLQRAKVTEPLGYISKPFSFEDLKIAIDISLHKYESDLKLYESQLWLKSTLESIGEGLIATDKNGKIKFLNSIAEKLTGFNPDEAIGKEINEVYNVQSDTSAEGLICYTNDNEKFSSDGYLNNKVLFNRQNKLIPIEDSMSAIVDDRSNVLGSIIIFRDITKRRETELAILAAKGYYLNFFEKFPIPIWRTNNQGEFNFFNTAWQELTGKNLGSQIFKGWIENIHKDDKLTFVESFNRFFGKKEKIEMEFRIEDKNSEYIWMLFVGDPFYDIKGNFDGYMGVCLDISNRKSLEFELLKAKNISEAANKAKSYFISNMSHEVRTPLNGILGLTEIMLDTDLDSDQREYLGLLKSSSKALLELLNNLLDFSKIEENKETLSENKFDLKFLVTDIVNTFNAQAKSKRISVVLNICDNMPERLFGDEKKVRQILNNLLSNALKFTFQGSISLSVKIAEVFSIMDSVENNLFVHFIVADTGTGIPEDKQHLVFESFTQIDSTFTKQFAGTGLGLTIVKKLVELMGGKIWFYSTPGKGSEFNFTVSLKRVVTTKDYKLKKINTL